MNCQSFEGLVNELAREQTMDASVRQEALLHSRSCAICGALLEDERLLTHTLREFSTRMRALTVSPAIEQALLAGFREHQTTNPVAEIHSRRRHFVYAAAAAAVLLLAFAAIAYQANLLRRQEKPVVLVSSGTGDRGIDVKNQPTTPGNRSSDSVGSPAVAKPNRIHLNSPRHRKAQRTKPISNNEAVAANHATTEVVSQFIPIGYSTVFNVEEGAQLLRVEMPRSAMVRFGLPVNMERYNERVKADVLVSADGLARAIRFVQ
jgi:hypothetical protein